MTDGPGKYDDLCTIVREAAAAVGVVVIVMGGNRGSGFSAQVQEPLTPDKLATLLEDVAKQIKG